MSVKAEVCLWFETQAEEAMAFYARAIPGFRSGAVMRSPETGAVLTVRFDIGGQAGFALNGGAPAPASHRQSMSLTFDTQAELDGTWAALLEGGSPIECGWLTDRYGHPWQVVPRVLIELLEGDNPSAARAAFAAMRTMVKLDGDAIRRAAETAQAAA